MKGSLLLQTLELRPNMNPFIDLIKKELEAKLPGIKFRLVRDSFLIEDPQNLSQVASFLKENPELRLDYLSSVAGADYLEYLESVYHFYSIEKKQGPAIFRVRVPKTQAVVPSLVPLYRGAEYQEREAYDTFGIFYEGHPDLRRLFMWEGFEGYPLRKDYEQEDADVLETQDIEWLEARRVSVPENIKKMAGELNASGKRAVAQKPVKPRN